MKLYTKISNDVTEINQIRTGSDVRVFKKDGGTIILPTVTYLEKRAAWLTLIEGYANSVYLDSKNLKTIGIGHYTQKIARFCTEGLERNVRTRRIT